MSLAAPLSARAPGLSFLAVDSFTAPEGETAPPPPRSALPPRSPFVTVYENEDAGAPDPRREAFAALVDELHDDEFEATLAAVQGHGRAFHDAQLAAGTSRPQADRLLTLHFEPLMRETAALVDAVAARYAPQEAAGLVEGEMEAFAENWTPEAPRPPEFENLFGGLFKKIAKKVGKVAKAVASKAWQGIKSLGLAPLLALVKKHLLGFLRGAVERVMGRIPAPLQPVARQLARKLGLPVPAEATAPSPPPANADASPTPEPAPAPADAGATQQELDEQLAGALLAGEDQAFEDEAAPGFAAAPLPIHAELDDARERFIDRLEGLKDGESPQPAMEEFLPALMPVLSAASKLIGHDRLAGWLAKLLAVPVGRFVGPAQASALSKALASAGLKALNMESADEATPAERLAAPAVAATVEEAAARVLALPAEVHADPALLEAFAMEAFETAAAANLPAVLPEAVYEDRPELLEAGVNVHWPMMPISRGALRAPRRYKRCSQVFNVTITPHLAAELESFEGAPLADYLQDQLAVDEPGELQAEVHLFEALPGSTLADIARAEAEILAPGAAAEAVADHFHPLTPQAASALLGRPGLGRAWWARSRHQPLGAGQRFYALRLAGGGRWRQRRRPLRLRLVLDGVRDELRASVYLSEAKAQRLAAQLRGSDPGAQAGALAARFQRWLQRRLWHLFFGAARHRLRIVDAGQAPGTPPAARAMRLPQPAARAFAAQLQSWLVKGFADGLRAQAPAIVAATEDAADGITLSFGITHPPGLKALLDPASAGPAPAAPGTAPMVTMSVHPGPHRA